VKQTTGIAFGLAGHVVTNYEAAGYLLDGLKSIDRDQRNHDARTAESHPGLPQPPAPVVEPLPPPNNNAGSPRGQSIGMTQAELAVDAARKDADKQAKDQRERIQYIKSLAMLTPAQMKELASPTAAEYAKYVFENVVGFIPILGPLVEAAKAGENENYAGAIFFYAMAAFDAVTLGASAFKGIGMASAEQIGRFPAGARQFPQIGNRGPMSLRSFDESITAYRRSAGLPVIQYGEQAGARIRGVRSQNCFAAGTPVLTPDGQKLIEDLRPGDLVLSRSEHDIEAPPEPRLVCDTFVRVSPVMVLQINGRRLRTTPEHPFYVKGKGWLCAKELRVGDLLATHDGEWVIVEVIEATGEVVTVYNVSVEDYHTYFVGHEAWGFAVWVHNADYFVVPEGSRFRLASEGNNGVVFFREGEQTAFREVPTFASLSEMATFLENKTLRVAGLSNQQVLQQGLLVRNARVTSGQLRGATPNAAGNTGHAYGSHGFTNDMVADIINNAQHRFVGDNGNRTVNIFIRNGDVVVTEGQDITRIITAYGQSGYQSLPGGRRIPGTAVNANQWANNPLYHEVR
jgi:Pretoxin HINT domain